MPLKCYINLNGVHRNVYSECMSNIQAIIKFPFQILIIFYNSKPKIEIGHFPIS